MANNSFETAGTNQGEAQSWTKATDASGMGIGAFNDVTTTFDSAESYEKNWYLPHVVHEQADTINGVTAAAATDLPTAIVLVNQIKDKYKAHRSTTGSIHIDPDVINSVNYNKATDQSTANVLANAIKAAFNAHLWNYPSVHHKWDSVNEVTGAGAYDLPSLLILANALKAAFNDHLATVGYGSMNQGSLFAFALSDLEAAAFHGDLTLESFEQGFAIPDILPLTTPAPPARQEQQSDEVSVDAPGVAAWPGGHVQFLNFFSYLAIEQGITETFIKQWYLPGNDTAFNNFWFYERYYTVATQTFAFLVDQLVLGILDTFDHDWRHNEEGEAKYYDGSMWRFTSAQVELFPLGAEVFDEADWPLLLP
jgi:hypothetical protein